MYISPSRNPTCCREETGRGEQRQARSGSGESAQRSRKGQGHTTKDRRQGSQGTRRVRRTLRRKDCGVGGLRKGQGRGPPGTSGTGYRGGKPSQGRAPGCTCTEHQARTGRHSRDGKGCGDGDWEGRGRFQGRKRGWDGAVERASFTLTQTLHSNDPPPPPPNCNPHPTQPRSGDYTKPRRSISCGQSRRESGHSLR